MESVQCDLYEYLVKNDVVTWNDIFTITQGISRGLYYLHEVNVVHQHISLKNIVLTKQFVAKLTSFEVAVTVLHDCQDIKEDPFYCDVSSFGQVLQEIISCTDPIKRQLLLFQSMFKFADQCLSVKTHPSSIEILDTINNYR